MRVNNVLTSAQVSSIIGPPIEEKIREGPNSIFYGETYDAAGHTLDSLKYYFFVDQLSKAIRSEGFPSAPTVMIADEAVCHNAKHSDREKMLQMGQDRLSYLQQAIDIYGLDIEPVLMSQDQQDKSYHSRRNRVQTFFDKNPDTLDAVRESVPPSQRVAEEKTGFRYSFDEIATIIDLDIKVGPPREDVYDSIARLITNSEENKSLTSVYLQPSFPLGKQWDYFFRHEGIETHGITAYKAASKQLKQFRVLPRTTSSENLQDLIENTFIPQHSHLPHPLRDLGIIAEHARQYLTGEEPQLDEMLQNSISNTDLRAYVGKTIDEYILKPFRGDTHE